MSMHRRFLLTSAGRALLASLAGSSLLEAAGKPKVAPPCPSPEPLPADITAPTEYGEARKDLIDCFYKGVKVKQEKVKRWGLNFEGIPESEKLDDDMSILGKEDSHLDQHYKVRLSAALEKANKAGKKIEHYGLLREQAAILGRLTRCMYERYPTKNGTLDPTHLNYAREALGFALNSGLQACLDKNCGFVVPDLQKKTKGPQLNQGCVLC